MTSKAHFADRSPYGWWIAAYIELAVWDDKAKSSPRSRCTAWENTIILKARNREAAYKKAIRLGKAGATRFWNHDGKRKGRWSFLGLTKLLPIYEELEDGAEVLWVEHSGRSLAKISARVKKKRELEVFKRS